tara:strand:- start:34 stop:309 length:276 start_codon:yes stop_codon:yes gene_type:complete
MSFGAEAFIGTMIIIFVVFAACLLLKITGETILCCINVYEFMSKKLNSRIRQTTVSPEIVIKPIKKLNYIVIENPNSIDGKKYSIGVVIKN